MKNKKIDIILSILLLAVFIFIGLLVRNTSEGLLSDIKILEFIHAKINLSLLEIMKIVSIIGSWKVLVPLIGLGSIYLLYEKRYYLAKLLISASLGSWIFNFILKFIFNRTRPLDYFLVEQGGLSYPSGHSMVSMSLYLTIAYLLVKYRPSKSKIPYIVAIFLVATMGISRLYLGVHWPTDVIGGFIMGYLYFRLNIKLIYK